MVDFSAVPGGGAGVNSGSAPTHNKPTAFELRWASELGLNCIHERRSNAIIVISPVGFSQIRQFWNVGM
jgi:hypothetical protein